MAEKQSRMVKWFKMQNGYRFIAPNGGNEDLFVHHSSLHVNGFRSLVEGGGGSNGGNGEGYGGDVYGRGGYGSDGSGYGGRGYGDGCCSGRGDYGGGACDNYGDIGLMMREFPQQRGSGGGGGACYKCGEHGHMAHECTSG
ncbi:hypothetical protein SUGI_0446880 [Cryptomeria japonica]|nr:hypothetical protein SUGI_0446880 [Cryptomeria japonica]